MKLVERKTKAHQKWSSRIWISGFHFICKSRFNGSFSYLKFKIDIKQCPQISKAQIKRNSDFIKARGSRVGFDKILTDQKATPMRESGQEQYKPRSWCSGAGVSKHWSWRAERAMARIAVLAYSELVKSVNNSAAKNSSADWGGCCDT